MWDLRDNIRFVILDWRQRPTGHSSRPVSSPVCVPWMSHYFTKRVPVTEERYVQTLWLYSYFTQTSPSKNRNNYIFIYLRVFHCLSSSSIYNMGENRWIQDFSWFLCEMKYKLPCQGFELRSPIQYPKVITVLQSKPLIYIYIYIYISLLVV